MKARWCKRCKPRWSPWDREDFPTHLIVVHPRTGYLHALLGRRDNETRCRQKARTWMRVIEGEAVLEREHEEREALRAEAEGQG